MSKKDLIRITLSLVATVLLSIIAAIFVYYYLSSFSVYPENIHPVEKPFIIQAFLSLLVFCLVFFFLLITLPFIFIAFIRKGKITHRTWPKILLGLEIFALLAAYFGTPPDLTSTLLLFVLFQIPIAINTLILYRITSRPSENRNDQALKL